MVLALALAVGGLSCASGSGETMGTPADGTPSASAVSLVEDQASEIDLEEQRLTAARDQVEEAVRSVLQHERGVEISELECAPHIPTDPAASAECSTRAQDVDGELALRVSLDADSVVMVEQVDAIVSIDEVESDIGDDLTEALGTTVSVSCGGLERASRRFIPVGETFTCVASAVGVAARRDVDVTVEGVDTSLSWVLNPG